jgi:hypothetical protein
LAAWYGLSTNIVVLIGSVNLVYACYSGRPAARASSGVSPTRAGVELLIAANLTWALASCVIALSMWHSARRMGLAHLIAEAVFVGGLAIIEFRQVLPYALADQR